MNNQFGYYPEIPNKIRDVFMELCQDLASLNSKWDFYLELFSDIKTTSLLSKMALQSFQLIEEALRADIVLSICRLNDPAKLGKHDNLSFWFLRENIVPNAEIDDAFSKLSNAYAPFKSYRDKKVGHNDLNTAIQPHSNPLPNINKEQVSLVINIASEVLNIILKCYVVQQLYFRSPQIGGAKQLVHYLNIAHEQYQNRK